MVSSKKSSAGGASRAPLVANMTFSPSSAANSPSSSPSCFSDLQKAKFSEAERVLCYEPDPTKVRVVYDAKILQVTSHLDIKGKIKGHEYLVHFQGWNASWDRFVPEDFLLKDNPDNRLLQKQLFAEAKQARLLASKKKSKKKKWKTPEMQGHASTSDTLEPEHALTMPHEPVYSLGPLPAQDHEPAKVLGAHEVTATQQPSAPPATPPESESRARRRSASLSVASTDASPAFVPVRLSETLKRHLESDYDLVCKKRRLTLLPAEPSIVQVLENFVRHYATGRLLAYEKHQTQSIYTAPKRRVSQEGIFQRALDAIRMCQEVAEGLRILIDCHLQSTLLYAAELDQFQCLITLGPPALYPEPRVSHQRTNKRAHAFSSSSSSSPSSVDSGTASSGHQHLTSCALDLSRKATRSSATVVVSAVGDRICAAESSVASASSSTSTSTREEGSCRSSLSNAHNRTSLLMPLSKASPCTPQASCHLRSLDQWKLVPRSVYLRQPPLPSLIYGPIHLLRLLVKMPEILGRMHIPAKTCKLIVRYMEAIVDYCDTHPDLFDPHTIYQ